MRYLRKGGGEPKVIGFAPPRLDFDDNPYFKRFTVEKDKLIIDRSGFNWLFIILGGLLSPIYLSYIYTSGLEMFTLPGPLLAWTVVLLVFNLGGGGARLYVCPRFFRI